MAGKSNGGDRIRCSFCDKTQDQVRKLIVGPKGVYICDACVDICLEIIEEEMDEYAPAPDMDINLLKPEELKAFLDDYVIGQEDAKRFFLLRFITITREYWLVKIQMWNCRRAIFSC